MKSVKVVAFSLLAHINDNTVGITSFDDIFIPIVKSALRELSDRGVKHGASLSDIKDKVDERFSLDIPIPYLSSLLEKIANEYSAKGSDEITLHKDGSFLLNQFVAEDFEK